MSPNGLTNGKGKSSVDISMETIKVNIKKPMYGNHVYINAAVVEKAIRLCVKLEIIVPAGRAIVDPNEWKAKKDWMKKVFKFKDRPMLLYGGNVPIPMPKTKGEIDTPSKREIEKSQAKLF